jgi:hypothetical protein
MRKKTKPTGWAALTPFTLYLEDIRDLHEIVAEVSDEVRYETETQTDIRGPDELITVGFRTVRELTITGIRGGQPTIVARFLPTGASAWSASDSNEMFGAIEKIKRVAWRHASNLSFVTTWYLWVLTVAGLGIWADSTSGMRPWTLIITGLVILAVLVAAVSESRSRYTTIYLVTREDAPGFWQRNRDNLLVGLILVAAATIATIASDLLPNLSLR